VKVKKRRGQGWACLISFCCCRSAAARVDKKIIANAINAMPILYVNLQLVEKTAKRVTSISTKKSAC